MWVMVWDKAICCVVNTRHIEDILLLTHIPQGDNRLDANRS